MIPLTAAMPGTERSTESSRPTIGIRHVAEPRMSAVTGCHSSGSELLSPWVTKPVAASPPMMRWMTTVPAPIAPSGTRKAMMSPTEYVLRAWAMTMSPYA